MHTASLLLVCAVAAAALIGSIDGSTLPEINSLSPSIGLVGVTFFFSREEKKSLPKLEI
jgi:hypothetical protein